MRRVDVQPDEIDRCGDDAEILGRVMRCGLARLGQKRISVFSLQYCREVTAVELARRDLGCSQVGGGFDSRHADGDIFRWAYPGFRPAMRADCLHRKPVSQSDIVSNLVQLLL